VSDSPIASPSTIGGCAYAPGITAEGLMSSAQAACEVNLDPTDICLRHEQLRRGLCLRGHRVCLRVVFCWFAGHVPLFQGLRARWQPARQPG
jgi:hypothetical protein